MTDLDPSGRDCLTFTVSGSWGHFRRVETTSDKQTYRVIPRTTVAGLIAAMLGMPRDSYYETFSRSTSAIAISPTSKLRTMAIPMLTVPTKEGDIQQADGVSGKTVIPPERLAEIRQRRIFEYVVDPSYRIDVVIDDDSVRSDLRERLRKGRYVYTPNLGKTECLARIDPADKQQTVSEETTSDTIESIVPESRVTMQPGVSFSMDRSPAYMERDDGGRRTTGYLSYAYNPDGRPLSLGDVLCHTVDGRAVCFI